jgi:metallo-beta-lactamase family protein
MESTYGDRLHPDYVQAENQLSDAMNRVLARGGKIIIPAFSVGRTQELVYAMNKLWNAGKMPRVPIYVDSPLSVNATAAFRAHPECFDEDVLREMKTDPDPFGFQGLIYTQSVDESKRINLLNGPCIIISASGMAESGRILHHLANNIGDPKNAVFIVGFQAENTLGRRIAEKQPEVKIFGEPYKLLAEVVTFDAFSAHGDQKDLRGFAAQCASSGTLRKIFLVHGEESAMTTLQGLLKQDLPGVEVLTPARGEVFDI